jgi:hypothetical protein
MTLQFLKNLHAFQFSSFLIYMHFAAIDIYIYMHLHAFFILVLQWPGGRDRHGGRNCAMHSVGAIMRHNFCGVCNSRGGHYFREGMHAPLFPWEAPLFPSGAP